MAVRLLATIICDECNQPVTQCTQQYIRENDEYLFIASCHGKFDRCRIPAEELVTDGVIVEARAFRKQSSIVDTEVAKAPLQLPRPEGVIQAVPLCRSFGEPIQMDQWAALVSDSI